MTELFIIYETGVYCRVTRGIFETLEEAKTEARAVISNPEHDGYHDIVIAKLTLGQPCKDSVVVGWTTKRPSADKYSYSTFPNTNNPVKEHFK